MAFGWSPWGANSECNLKFKPEEKSGGSVVVLFSFTFSNDGCGTAIAQHIDHGSGHIQNPVDHINHSHPSCDGLFTKAHGLQDNQNGH